MQNQCYIDLTKRWFKPWQWLVIVFTFMGGFVLGRAVERWVVQ